TAPTSPGTPAGGYGHPAQATTVETYSRDPELGGPMIVTVNGEDRTLADGATVSALVTELDLPDEGVAIAVDGVVVPSSGWDDAPLGAGAEIDVLTAVQGG
ncbi:sulfur carrier protein ThiS, partial [Dietzia kunjamensis]|uniref:sulfur carrier protein ThiS n=2 Tax=Dietzia kunjamensis TaxID=322509 RepID=UPI003BA9C1F6